MLTVKHFSEETCREKEFVKSPELFTSSEGQDHLSLMPLLYKSSSKLSENAMLCSSPSVLASHIAVCHQLILISCGLQPPAQEEAEISITEVSKKHDFRWKFKSPHEHPSLNV